MLDLLVFAIAFARAINRNHQSIVFLFFGFIQKSNRSLKKAIAFLVLGVFFGLFFAYSPKKRVVPFLSFTTSSKNVF